MFIIFRKYFKIWKCDCLWGKYAVFILEPIQSSYNRNFRLSSCWNGIRNKSYVKITNSTIIIMTKYVKYVQSALIYIKYEKIKGK